MIDLVDRRLGSREMRARQPASARMEFFYNKSIPETRRICNRFSQRLLTDSHEILRPGQSSQEKSGRSLPIRLLSRTYAAYPHAAMAAWSASAKRMRKMVMVLSPFSA